MDHLNRLPRTKSSGIADLEGKLLGQGLTEDEVAKVIGRMGVSASPEEIIDDLIWLAEQLNTQKSDDQHRLFIRQVIRQFEALTAIEREALPEIKAFLDELEEVIFRENTEDIYAGIEWMHGTKELEQVQSFLMEEMNVKNIRFPDTVSLGVKPISKEGTQRLVQAAINEALSKRRKSYRSRIASNIRPATWPAAPVTTTVILAK